MVVCFMMMAMPSRAVILHVEDGLLTGASDVNLFGNLYRMEFVNGSCQSLFAGCDELADFTWQSRAEADAVYAFMRDNVFVDELNIGNFRSDMNSVFGCESAIGNCFINEPYFVESDSFGTYTGMDHVLFPGALHGGGFAQRRSDFDTTDDPNSVFAVWYVTSGEGPPIVVNAPGNMFFFLLLSFIVLWKQK